MLLYTYLDIARLVEPVHLVQQLEQDTLHLTVSTCLRVEPLRGDGVNLVNEDNTWRMLLSHPEQFSYELGTVSEILLNELGTDNTKESGGRLVATALARSVLPVPGTP